LPYTAVFCQLIEGRPLDLDAPPTSRSPPPPDDVPPDDLEDVSGGIFRHLFTRQEPRPPDPRFRDE